MSGEEKMEALLEGLANAIETFVKRVDPAVRRLELALVMQNLMVMQLDGVLEVGKDTMGLYLNALGGSTRSFNAFVRHVKEKYFRKD